MIPNAADSIRHDDPRPILKRLRADSEIPNLVKHLIIFSLIAVVLFAALQIYLIIGQIMADYSIYTYNRKAEQALTEVRRLSPRVSSNYTDIKELKKNERN